MGDMAKHQQEAVNGRIAPFLLGQQALRRIGRIKRKFNRTGKPMGHPARATRTETERADAGTQLPKAVNDDIANANEDAGIATIKKMIALSEEIGEPVVMRIQISPITAAWILGQNDDNRNVSEPKVIQYATDITEGRWMENGDGIGIAVCGSLNNGQHRCYSVMRSGITITTNVTVGLQRKSRGTNDIGLPRTLSGLLTMDGIENSSIVGVMAKLIIGWEQTKTAAKRPTRESSPTRVREYIAENRSIGDSALFVRSLKVPKGFLSKPQIGFFHHILKKHDPEHADEFICALVSGNEDGRGLRIEDPRNVIRTRLIAEHKLLNHADRVELVFRAWNAWREDRALEKSRITGTLPELV